MNLKLCEAFRPDSQKSLKRTQTTIVSGLHRLIYSPHFWLYVLCLLPVWFAGAALQDAQRMVRYWMATTPVLSWTPLGTITDQEPWISMRPCLQVIVKVRRSREGRAILSSVPKTDAFAGSSLILGVLNFSSTSESSRNKWTLLTRERNWFPSPAQTRGVTAPIDLGHGKS